MHLVQLVEPFCAPAFCVLSHPAIAFRYHLRLLFSACSSQEALQGGRAGPGGIAEVSWRWLEQKLSSFIHAKYGAASPFANRIAIFSRLCVRI